MATPQVRYSDGKPTSDAKPRFPWEYPVPDTPFWNSLSFVVGRNFLSNFSPEEIEELPIDQDSDAPKNEKLALLNELLHQHLDEKDLAASPATFYDTDYPAWDKLWLGIFTMQQELQRPEAEQTMRMLCDRRKDQTNLSHFHTLAGLLLARGEYAEAEEMERKVQVWLERKLGKDSPQALGAQRIIVQSLWGQGVARRREAEQLMADMERIIDDLGKGQYEMYQEEERKLLKDMKNKLEKAVT